MGYIEQLEQRAYAEVPYAGQEALQAAFRAFPAFLFSLSQEQKHAGDYNLSGKAMHNGGKGTFGYFRRVAGSEQDGRRIAADNKHTYHYGSLTRQTFLRNGTGRILGKEVSDFCSAADEAYWDAVTALKQTLIRIREDQFGRNGNFRILTPLELFYVDDAMPLNLILRIIGYEPPASDKTELAEGHFDRSDLTMPLGETATGLEIGFAADGSDLRQVEPLADHARFMVGGGWQSLPRYVQAEYPFLRPAFHRVRNPRLLRTPDNPIARYSGVLFANSLHHNTDVPPAQTRPHELAPST